MHSAGTATFAFCSPRIYPRFVAMILFCMCGSDKVDIARWDNKDRALLECQTCKRTHWIEGFTIGRFDFVEQLFGAVLDQARKYRKRDPSDRMQLLQHQIEE